MQQMAENFTGCSIQSLSTLAGSRCQPSSTQASQSWQVETGRESESCSLCAMSMFEGSQELTLRGRQDKAVRAALPVQGLHQEDNRNNSQRCRQTDQLAVVQRELGYLSQYKTEMSYCLQQRDGHQDWDRTAAAPAAAKLLQSCPTVQPHRRQPTRLPRPWDSHCQLPKDYVFQAHA